MKAAAISLLVLVLVFLVNMVGIFVSPAYKERLQGYVGTRANTAVVAKSAQQPADPDDVTKLQETIEQLAVGLNALSQTGSNARPTQAPTGTGAVSSGTGAATPAAVPAPVPEKPKPKEYPLGIPLQAKLMPDVFVKKVDNKGIFDIKIFSNLDYTTYRDDKAKMNIYAFADSYPVILANLKLASNVYGVKETDTFFEASFFLNSTNTKDTTIRFVAAIDGKAYGFEVPKAFYPRIKKLLTHK